MYTVLSQPHLTARPQAPRTLRMLSLCAALSLFSLPAYGQADDIVDNTPIANELSPNPAYGQADVADNASVDNIFPPDWVPHPYSLEANLLGGGFVRPVLQITDPADMNTGYNQHLYLWGVRVDAGVIQLHRSIWRHFQCHPKLGGFIDIRRLQNKGYILRGIAYISPHRDYRASWEIVPKIGIGIAYANVPFTNFEDDKKEGSEQEKVSNNDQPDPYRSGIGIDVSLGISLKTRLSPHWEVSQTIEYNHILDREDKESDNAFNDKKDLKMVTYALGVNYTYNPSTVRYLPEACTSTVELCLLGTAKKPEKSHDKKDNTYHPVAGIQGLFSLPISAGSALTLANEWRIDWAAKKDLEDKVKTNPLKISVLVGHRFLLGKLTLGQQLGFYVKDNTKINGSKPWEVMYIRLNADFRLAASFFVGASLNIQLNHLQKKSTGAYERVFKGPNEEFVAVKVGYCF